MSHVGNATCSITNANQTTLARAIQILCELEGGKISEGAREVTLYMGQKQAATGTVVKGLQCAAYGTDADIWVDSKGTIHIKTDSNGLSRIKQKLEVAYAGAAREIAMKRLGMAVKTTVNKASKKVQIVGVMA